MEERKIRRWMAAHMDIRHQGARGRPFHRRTGEKLRPPRASAPPTSDEVLARLKDVGYLNDRR